MKTAAANPGEFLSQAPRDPAAFTNHWDALNNIWAIAGVVILELKRRKDFYALFIVTAIITMALGSVSFFNEDNIVRYVKEICLFLIWTSSLVIAVTTAARQIPAEKDNRTIFPLLAKPVTRGEVMMGKFLGCWLATGACLICFYVFFGLVAGLREHSWPVVAYFQAMILHWFMLAIVVAISLLGSLIFAAPSSNNTITLVVVTGLLLLGRHLNKVALQLDEPLQSLLYTIYFLVPHLEFFDVRDLVIHHWGTIPWSAWSLAVGYAGFYTSLFLVLSMLRFRRRAVI